MSIDDIDEVDDCQHPHMQVYPNAEGDLTEAHLTRHFTTYYCPDCDYEAEEPPEGWEPPEPDYEAMNEYR